MPEHLEIRPAEPADAELIFSLVQELAEYEQAADELTGNPAMLREALFGTRQAEALIAERRGEPLGFALFFSTFSSWECRPSIWIEDLYVRPTHRRDGVGRTLVGEVAAIAVARGCARLEWSALDWNRPALDFYAKLGASRLEEWVTHRVDGVTLYRLAARD